MSGVAGSLAASTSPYLLQGGIVLIPGLEDGSFQVVHADVRVEGGVIVAIGRDLPPAHDDEQLTMRDCILIPGFIDTHRHVWQTAFRGIAADWTLAQYVAGMHGALRDFYEPDDLYLGNLAGRVEALSAGITTMLDWSHGITSSEHGDAALQALQDAPGRSVFAYAGPVGPTHDRPVVDELARLHSKATSGPGSGGGIVTMALGLRGPQYTSMSTTLADVEAARDLDLRVSVHGGSAHFGHGRPIAAMRDANVLDDRTTIIHCNTLHDDELDMMVETRASASVSPIVEMQMGFGWPATGRLLDRGIRPSLSIDNCAAISGDMFQTMQTTLHVQRALDNQGHPDASRSAEMRLSCTSVLDFATRRGADALGMSAVGSLEVGQQADIIAVRADDFSLFPLNDPIASVVLNGSPGLVSMVMVQGRLVKRDGVMLGLDPLSLRERLLKSQARIVGRARRAGIAVSLDGSWQPL